MNFANEPLNKFVKSSENECFDLSHEMPVMEAMTVVLSEHAAIVHTTSLQVDVSEAVSYKLSILKPDFALSEERPYVFLSAGVFRAWCFEGNASCDPLRKYITARIYNVLSVAIERFLIGGI